MASALILKAFAVAVVFEVALFHWSQPLLARVSAEGLIVLAVLITVVRWLGTAVARDAWLVLPGARNPIRVPRSYRVTGGFAVADVARTRFVDDYDAVVFATHPPETRAILGDVMTAAEREVLGALPYQGNEAVLHTDTSLLPRNRRAWAALLSSRDLADVMKVQQEWGLQAATDYAREATRVARLATTLSLTGTTPAVLSTAALLA